MNPNTTKDSIFSSGKPKNLPWFFVPLMSGVVALIVLFKWFD
jgi:hypothetical protein